MYRYTYLGYACGKNVSVAESEQVYFSLVGSFNQMTFIYLETPVRDLDPDAVVKGEFIPFPDGKRLARMEQIFYCDDWHDDAVLSIPRKERKPYMKIMRLNHDAGVLAYIGHHYVLQEAGQVTWDRYYSIYELGNTLISVGNEETIAVPHRQSAFDVDIKSVIAATLPVIEENKIPYADGTTGWRNILRVNENEK